MKSGGTYILGITLLASLFFIVFTIPTELLNTAWLPLVAIGTGT